MLNNDLLSKIFTHLSFHVKTSTKNNNKFIKKEAF